MLLFASFFFRSDLLQASAHNNSILEGKEQLAVGEEKV